MQIRTDQIRVMGTATVTWPEPKKSMSMWARLVAWLRRKG